VATAYCPRYHEKQLSVGGGSPEKHLTRLGTLAACFCY